MALPLANRITHKPVYVPSNDDAWDHDRIEREKAQILEGEESPWPELEDHPVVRYQGGVSRYDLATVQDYLDPSKSPLRFNLRRLNLNEWDECQALAEGKSGGVVYASGPSRLYAIQKSLESVEGLPEWQAHRKRKGWDVEDVEALRDILGEHEYIMLGFAAIAASRPLDPREKKL